MLFYIKCTLIAAAAVIVLLAVVSLIARKTQDGRIAHALHLDTEEPWRHE